MKVKAIQLGYYNHRRQREGVVFDLIKDSDFSEAWMKRIDEESAKKSVKQSKKAKTVDQDEEVI